MEIFCDKFRIQKKMVEFFSVFSRLWLGRTDNRIFSKVPDRFSVLVLQTDSKESFWFSKVQRNLASLNICFVPEKRSKNQNLISRINKNASILHVNKDAIGFFFFFFILKKY